MIFQYWAEVLHNADILCNLLSFFGACLLIAGLLTAERTAIFVALVLAILGLLGVVFIPSENLLQVMVK